MEFSQKLLKIKNTANFKYKSLEYLIGIILALSLWLYHTYHTGKISQEIYSNNEGRIYGLEDAFFNTKRDYSDHQWRNFRKSLPIIFIFAFVYLLLSQITKKYFPKYLNYYYLIIGLGYGIYLHSVKILILLFILIVNFSFIKIYSILGSKLFTILTWTFGCSIKILSEIYGGFTFKALFGINIDEHCELSWHLVFGLILLRIISFNMEFKKALQAEKNKDDIEVKKLESNTHCESCKQNNFCLKFLSDSEANLKDFSLVNYLAYIFYPPLYFSGPTLLFNSFVFQVNNFKVSQHQDYLSFDKVTYIIRYIIVFVCFEVFNSYIYVNAYLTNKYNKFIWESFDHYTYSAFCFYLLIFIWFKFTIIWRTSRIWAWLDGIYTEENMNRCICNNYSFEGFWRAWHRSFNIWLIKYIFIPLGGSKYKVANIWVVFSFVALWHDLQLNLLIWGWFICLFMMPEIVVKTFFNSPKRAYLNDYLIFRFLKYLFCAFYIVLMVIANLIGFGMGHEGLGEIIINTLKLTTINYFMQILLFLIPSVIAMFYIREKEEEIYIKNKNNF